MRVLKLSLLLLVAAGVAGCGSGGGGLTTPTIVWPAPAAILYGTPLGSNQLDAGASVAGTFIYSPALGTVLQAGAQTLSVKFTPNDSKSYNSASATVTLVVNQVKPAITWLAPVAVTAGTALSSLQLDATASVPGSFVYTPPAGTPMNTVGNATLSATFTPTDRVDYALASDSVTLAVTAVSGAGTATLDFGTPMQAIRGFGGSTAWMPQLTSSQAATLFGQSAGDLGLSILRVRIDPGGQANWGTELANAQQAQALGASVIATPWTPPVSMKSNANVTMGSLNPTSYGDYANYLESFVTYMASGNVNLYGISMQNEPDAIVNYESCSWTGAQMDKWVANNASVLTTRLIMPESQSFDTSYSDPTLSDSKALANVSIIAGHLYGTAPYYYVLAKNGGKDVWMTEHFLTPAQPEPTIADALAAAEEIHASMTTAEYNAYLWWWVANWNPQSGIPDIALIDAKGNPTYFGYALGQYARFIRPGYVRVSTTGSLVPGVYVSAYKGNGHVAIVVINSTNSAATLNLNILNQTLTTLTPYQTTVSGGLSAQNPVGLSNNTLSYTLPVESITTFVQ